MADAFVLPPGLSSEEALARRAQGRGNRVQERSWQVYLDIFRRNTLTIFNGLVAPAAAALFVLRDYRGAWAVSAVAVANVVMGLAQEVRAHRHLAKLELMRESRVRVRRDGAEQTIASGDVVEGDLVLLAAGDLVVADGALAAARFPELDEGLLPGESDPGAKDGGESVRSGSGCVAGEGAYVAERVGSESFIQRSAAMAKRYRYSAGPTQRTLNR